MYFGEKVLVGLERGEAADYAMRLNLAAQIIWSTGRCRERALEKQWFCNQPSCALHEIGSSSPLAFHADMPIYIQLPGLGFQQRP
jgi:hypothetical protein